jgi:hypothetical protein
VFKDGIYRVDVGELGTDRVKVLRDLRAERMADGAGIIEIELQILLIELVQGNESPSMHKDIFLLQPTMKQLKTI